MKPRLDLRLAQKLVMTPQLQQAIKLLQLSRLELSQMVSQELLENPLLEDQPVDSEETETSEQEDALEDKDGDKGEETADQEDMEFSSKWEEYISDIQQENRDSGNTSPSGEEPPSYEQTLTRAPSLLEHLLWQLGLSAITQQQAEIGKVIIGNVDDDGYLRTNGEEMAVGLGVTPKDVEEVLTIIQDFDPMGVAARDLQECLRNQLRQLGLHGSKAYLIVSNHLKDIETRNFKKMTKVLGISMGEVLELVRIIQGLEPKPGRPFFADEAQIIIPDIYVIKSDKDYIVVLNDDGLPKLRINPYYRRLLAQDPKGTDATRGYLQDRFRSAVWLVRSIEQRNRTICKVAQSIVKFQLEFFDGGINYLKPLILRQVADDITMHESTISRVTTNKYMHTPQGIFELKYFFNSSLSRSGETGNELSSATVREMIRRMIDKEDSSHPVSDQEIVARLRQENIKIARRTVAKYRSELKIPQASRRRFIS